MDLWRLSGALHAEKFDGGGGLVQDGRWHSAGRPITYTSTHPSLCLLEKRVHLEGNDPIPTAEMLVRYDVPEGLAMEGITLEDLPDSWTDDESSTQRIGDEWLARTHETGWTPLMMVPSAVIAAPASTDRNVLINHNHPDTASITIVSIEPLRYDPRLF